MKKYILTYYFSLVQEVGMHLYLLVKLVFHELLSCFLVLIQTSFATERYESITALFRMVEHICQKVYLPFVEHFLQCFFAMVAFQNSLFHTLHLFRGYTCICLIACPAAFCCPWRRISACISGVKSFSATYVMLPLSSVFQQPYMPKLYSGS